MIIRSRKHSLLLQLLSDHSSSPTTRSTPWGPRLTSASGPNLAAGLSTCQDPPRERFTNIREIFCKFPRQESTHFNVFPSSCSCSGENVCSLTRDALQQNSFVFYCRPKETSKFRSEKLIDLLIENISIFVVQVSWGWEALINTERILINMKNVFKSGEYENKGRLPCKLISIKKRSISSKGI